MEYATKLQDASGYEALRRVRRLHQWRKRWGLGHGKIEISCGAAGACGPDGRRGTSQLGLGVGRDRGGRHQVGYRDGGDVAQLGAPGRGGCPCAGRGEQRGARGDRAAQAGAGRAATSTLYPQGGLGFLRFNVRMIAPDGVRSFLCCPGLGLVACPAMCGPPGLRQAAAWLDRSLPVPD